MAQLPGFKAIEGPEEDEEKKSKISKMEFEDEGNIIYTPIKKKPKTISFTKGELNKYLMSKESQDVLKENLPNPSNFRTELSDFKITQKYYNKAEEKINAVKKDFNPNIISTVYEDGRYIAYPKSKNPCKDTQEKINKFNTLSNYAFSMQKLIEYKIKTGSGIFYFTTHINFLTDLNYLVGQFVLQIMV